MAESARSKKPAGDAPGRGQSGGAKDIAPAKRGGPAWAGHPAGIAVPLQRKAQVNEPGDAYEKEAESVADRVSGGGQYPAGKISSVTPGSIGGAQRAAKPDEKKPDHDEKAVQKADKPEDKKDDKTKAVQKADKPEEKKDDKTKAVQKADKPDEKKDDKTKAVQKAGKPEEKKEKDDKTKAVQKAGKPEEKKDDKTKAVQKAGKPEEKKDDKTKAVQKADAPKEHADAPVQMALKKDTMPPEKTMPPKGEGPEKESKAAPKPAGGGAEPKAQAPKAAAGPQIQKADAPSSSPASSPSAAASHAIANKGSGSPLAPRTRSSLEHGLGADLSHVRVHDDSRAQESAKDLSARAFTHQNDIWLGKGESQSDTKLMAHEATHVIQQSNSVQRAAIQRTTTPPPPGTAAAASSSVEKEPGVWVAPEGTVDTNGDKKKITIPELSLPPVYGKYDSVEPKSNFILPKPKARTDQRDNWKKKIAGAGTTTKPVEQLLTPAKAVDSKAKPDPSSNLWYLKLIGEGSYLVGDKASLLDRLKIPNWHSEGTHLAFDVDHIRELQVGGEPDDLNNYQLLEASANRSSGSRIKNEIEGKIMGVVGKNVGAGKPWTSTPDPEEVKNNSEITFQKVVPTLQGVKPGRLWKKDDVALQGSHLAAVEALNSEAIEAAHLRDDPSVLKIFTSAGAGAPKMIPWNAGNSAGSLGQDTWGYKGLEVTGVTFQPGGTGTITGQAWKDNKVVTGAPISLALTAIPGLQYSATASAGALKQQLGKALNAKGSSPIEIFDVDLGVNGIVASGVIRPDFSILKGTEIDFLIDGNDVTLSKTFYGGQLKLPGPIHVTGGSLTISAGTKGLEIDGNVNFVIEKLGKGSVGAHAAMAQGFEINGAFKFDTDMFDPAEVHIKYKRGGEGEGEWSGSGDLGIKEGTITGIKSANIKASYEKGELAAAGNVKLSVPGIQEGTMEAKFSEKDGISIGGKFILAGDIPGIAGGSVEAKVEQKEGRWAVTAKGSATPKIPGIAATLDVAYEDGAITIEGHAAYEKGMLKGEITLGATNRPVDAQGKPGGAPTPTMRAYGGGSVTIQIAPWLKGTVGVRLLPNGEIEVSGTIALPSTLDIFPEKAIHKNIFSINLDIPIFGVAVAGQRIGIFATIGGGLDAEAGIGPGQLRDTSLTVTYNPAHEEDTHVSGNARLYIPAHAGLRLFVRGGIGAGIPIVSATAGLEIGAQLGLEGAIDTSLHVDWSPKTGLELTAQGEIFVEPKFKFDLTGFVMVTADLILTTIELYNKRFTLASFEYGSDLRFGVRFPIHYKEGQPFDISLSDVEFITPKVDTGDILSGIVKKVV